MPDEADLDRNELWLLVRELLERQHEADQLLRTDPHAAVKAAVEAAVHSLMKLAACMADDAPSRVTPGAALVRLLAALDDRDEGRVSPLLQPLAARGGNSLDLMTRIQRATVAAALELLLRSGCERKAAAEQVVAMMGQDHRLFAGLDGERWRIVARWRESVMTGDDVVAKQQFDRCLADAADFLGAREAEATAEDFVRLARIALRELDRYA